MVQVNNNRPAIQKPQNLAGLLLAFVIIINVVVVVFPQGG